MLFLTFQLGKDWYALQASEVVEVLPRVHCKIIPRAPAGVAGVFTYHGAPVPLIDLAALSLGKPSRPRMSTRIILINYTGPAGKTHRLGLLAEQATAAIRREKSDFVEASVTGDGAPYLGRVTKDPRGLIQLIEPRRLLSPEVCDALFRETVEA